ncbi:MAG: nucleotidyltransferase substrate binding protein [Rickettsia sp.]|jgi:nucleotidyltransferase substrate binding protein (TIGR01987 family)|nr:nucleotidyltransferase substrate binding protein [Rickettsia sp.]
MTTFTSIKIPRWLYRFDNFKRAFALLREAMYTMRERKISQLEMEGVVQRFEYTWELTWNVLKDYLEHKGVILSTITPATVLKAAIVANLIKNGEVWMNALDSRNKMSHTYDFKQFEQIIINIEKDYYPELENMYLVMLKFAEEEMVDESKHI